MKETRLDSENDQSFVYQEQQQKSNNKRKSNVR
jgi:hypothetical protein